MNKKRISKLKNISKIEDQESQKEACHHGGSSFNVIGTDFSDFKST